MESVPDHELRGKWPEMEWKTFDGRIADTDTADHQHVSNCLWFAVVFGGAQGFDRSRQEEYKQTLIKRFGNKILPYRPHPLFHGEIEGLINAGMVYQNDMGDNLIIINRKIIGEVLKSTHPLYFTTK